MKISWKICCCLIYFWKIVNCHLPLNDSLRENSIELSLELLMKMKVFCFPNVIWFYWKLFWFSNFLVERLLELESIFPKGKCILFALLQTHSNGKLVVLFFIPPHISYDTTYVIVLCIPIFNKNLIECKLKAIGILRNIKAIKNAYFLEVGGLTPAPPTLLTIRVVFE